MAAVQRGINETLVGLESKRLERRDVCLQSANLDLLLPLAVFYFIFMVFDVVFH